MINIEEELLKYHSQGISIIEASSEIAMKHSLEIETIGAVISNNSKLKELSYKEACDLKLVKDFKIGKFPK